MVITIGHPANGRLAVKIGTGGEYGQWRRLDNGALLTEQEAEDTFRGVWDEYHPVPTPTTEPASAYGPEFAAARTAYHDAAHEWTRAEDCPVRYEPDGSVLVATPDEYGNPDAPLPALVIGESSHGTALAVEGTATDLRAFLGRAASKLPRSAGMTEEEYDDLYDGLADLIGHYGWPTSEATYDLLHALVDSMGDRREQDDEEE